MVKTLQLHFNDFGNIIVKQQQQQQNCTQCNYSYVPSDADLTISSKTILAFDFYILQNHNLKYDFVLLLSYMIQKKVLSSKSNWTFCLIQLFNTTCTCQQMHIFDLLRSLA